MQEPKRALGAADAASRLGVRREEVYRLIRSGVLPSERVAGRIVVTEDALRRLKATPRPVGRPFSAAAAWAILWMLSYQELPSGFPGIGHMSAARRSQLRRHLREDDAIELAARLRGRARRQPMYAHPAAHDHLRSAAEATPTGYSALEQVEANLVVGPAAPVEIYVDAEGGKRLTEDLGLLGDAGETNVVLHVVSDVMAVPRSMGVASPPVVALDLIESGDTRTDAAGRELWRSWLERYRADHGR